MDEEELMARFVEMQKEVLLIGWKGILAKYHPDMCYGDAIGVSSEKIFEVYKAIYNYTLEVLGLEE
jgi:hypothetical protein